MLNADQYNIHKYLFIASFSFLALSLFIWFKGNGNLSKEAFAMLGGTTSLAATTFGFGLQIWRTRKRPPKDTLKLAHVKAHDLLDKIARSESGHHLTNAPTGEVRIANIPGVYKYQHLLNELYALVPACQLPQNYRGTVIDWHKYDLCIIASEERKNLAFARKVKQELERQIEGWSVYLDAGEGIGEKQLPFIDRIFYASSRRCLALLSAHAVTDPRRKLELNAAMRREKIEGEACGDYLKAIPIDENGLDYMYDNAVYLREYAVNVKIIEDEDKLLDLILKKYTDPNTIHYDPSSPLPQKKVADKRFAVALSFPGEHRGYVKIVAEELKDHLSDEKVFYDDWYKAELARPNLDIYLQAIYREKSELVVVFLCAEYEAKSWCGLEWRAVRDLLKEKQEEAIMPVRFDKTHISGLFSIDGYIDAENLEPKVVAKLIIERLIQNRQP